MKLIFIFLFSLFAMEERRESLLNIIDEELKEIQRLVRYEKRKNPDFLLRMAELNLEKARLYKEHENEKYISLSPKKRRKSKKSYYFKTSRKYFQNAQKICKKIIKRYKGFSRRGEVFYIMAFNAKEFGRYEKAFEYFKRAVRAAPSGSNIKVRSGLALADIYYNKNKFRKAISLYEKYLKKKGNKWWTKTAYNLAWCYFRIKNYNKALGIIKEVHKLSENKKYIDMRYQVERNIIMFFAEARKMDEAFEFYEKIGKKGDLLDIGIRFFKQGKFSYAKKIFQLARRKKKNDKEDIDIYLAELDVYEILNELGKYHKASKKLLNYYRESEMNSVQKEQLIQKIKKMAGVLQRKVVKNVKKSSKWKIRGRQVKEYFLMLAELEPRQTRHVFHAAETLYAIGDFKQAFFLYQKSMNKASKDKKTQRQALDGMMACLGKKGIDQSVKKKYLIQTYHLYMKTHPGTKESSKLSQRIFSHYLKKNKIKKAEDTLLGFKKQYPHEVKIHETMLAQIIDVHQKVNNKKAIKYWIGRIQRGEFKVNKKVKKRLEILLLNMEFEKIEQANRKGDKTEAIEGYIAIYNDDQSSLKARKNSAYNVTTLFYESGNHIKTHEWLLKTLVLMKPSDVLKFEGSFLTMAVDLFNRRQFYLAADTYENIFDKLCHENFKNKKVFFKNAVLVYLSIPMYKKAEEMLRKGRNCRIPSSLIKTLNKDYLKILVTVKDWEMLENKMVSFLKMEWLHPDLIHPLYLLYQRKIRKGDKREARFTEKHLMRLYKKSVKKRKKIPLKGLDAVISLKLIPLEKEWERFKEVKLSFPEKKYNSLLQNKFKMLGNLTDKTLDILKVRSGKGIIRGYYLLTEGYGHLIREITGFTPPGKSKEYVKSFKKSMRQLVIPVRKKMNQYTRRGRKQIQRDNILSKDNFRFFMGKLPFEVRFFPETKEIVMDRRGRR